MGKFCETTLQLWPLIYVQNCIFVTIKGWGRGGPLLFTAETCDILKCLLVYIGFNLKCLLVYIFQGYMLKFTKLKVG